MSAAFTNLEQLHLVELAIVFAAIGYVTQLAFDITGRSRSSQTLRRENEDLVRRNKELEVDVVALRHEVVRLEADIAALRAQIAKLEERDQAAVLSALKLHEERADKRWDGTIVVLSEIRDVLTKPPKT